MKRFQRIGGLLAFGPWLASSLRQPFLVEAEMSVLGTSRKKRLSVTLAGCLSVAVAGLLAVPQATSAEESVVAMMELTTELVPNAKVMTLVVDVAPGTEFPLHSHGGPGVATLLSGELGVTFPDGSKRHLVPGEVFVEDAGLVHGAIVGAAPARFVWTLVLPDGAEMEIPYGG